VPIGSSASSPGSATTSERLLDAAVGVVHDMAGMSPVLIVIAAAVLVGLLAGGSLRNFERLRVHWWAIAFVGLGLQIVPVREFAHVPIWAVGAGMLATSYVLLLSFLAVNRWIPGAAVMAIGLMLNLAVVGANGGMPVSASAIEAAGGSVAVLADGAGAKHHLMNDANVLWPLGDVIPIPPPAGVVLSVGDLLLYAGIAWFVVQVMRGRSRETPRPIAMWFPAYRGKHAPGHWRLPPRYRAAAPVAAERSGSEP
jgi:hypothetical protein